MPKTVECDVLRYASRLNPILEIQGEQGLCHSLEHLPRGTLAAEGKGFVRQRQNSFRPCLFGDDVHTPAAVRRPDDVLPLQADDVADVSHGVLASIFTSSSVRNSRLVLASLACFSRGAMFSLIRLSS